MLHYRNYPAILLWPNPAFQTLVITTQDVQLLAMFEHQCPELFADTVPAKAPLRELLDRSNIAKRSTTGLEVSTALRNAGIPFVEAIAPACPKASFGRDIDLTYGVACVLTNWSLEQMFDPYEHQAGDVGHFRGRDYVMIFPANIPAAPDRQIDKVTHVILVPAECVDPHG